MNIDFDKMGGLVPAVVQHADTKQILMVGFMNAEAWQQTEASGKVTFYSRSKERLWTKGESSGNYLTFVSAAVDCDNDTLLIQAQPAGPTCHTGSYSCFGAEDTKGFVHTLDALVRDRKANPQAGSYTNSLFDKGINKVAQKVGEEAVELVIEAKDNNTELFLNEAADLMYHYLVLLAAKGHKLEDVEAVLKDRHG